MPSAFAVASPLALTPTGWVIALLGAFIIGMNKGGLMGVGILPVLFFAAIFPPRDSTGLVVPLLLTGDCCAVIIYRRVAVWRTLLLLLPPALAGIVLGYFSMGRIPAALFGPLIGWIVLALVALQLSRRIYGTRFDRFFQSHGFGWMMGVLAGFTTMVANAAGPTATIYFLSVGLAKWNLIGTSAWLFFTLNWCKVPFSLALGLITPASLKFSLLLAPVVLLGFFAGRKTVGLMPEKVFDGFLLVCTVVGALRLIW